MERDPFKEYLRESEPDKASKGYAWSTAIGLQTVDGLKSSDYNITKQERVLDVETVLYGSASELRATLEYDFMQERNSSYKGLSTDEMIHHFAIFVSRLW
ncbi:hypothetical protein ACTM9N_15005 [Lachnospiraceae bacterium HCP1S3_A8]